MRTPIGSHARARLIAHGLPVVVTTAESLLPKHHARFSDLRQEGVVALARAVDSFLDGAEDARFDEFVTSAVRRALTRTVRQWRRDRRRLSERPVETIPDPLTDDPFSLAAEQEDDRRLEEMLGALPEIEQRVVRLRFGIGERHERTLGAVGARLGMDAARVNYLAERALLSLRRASRRRRASQ